MNAAPEPVNNENPDSIAAELLAIMDTTRTPEPGIHMGIPEHEYHGHWKAISSSLLRAMKRSPMHARHMMIAPPADPTPAMQLGTAVHAAILQPDEFRALYAAIPAADKRTTAGKNLVAAFMADNAGKRFLSEADYQRCLAMRDAALRVPLIQKLISGRGGFEVSATWRDEPTGLLCKLRADRVSLDVVGGTIVDIKTTTDARARAFERKIFDMGYHTQGAHYVDGIRANGLPVENYSIIAVENEAPFAIAVYRMREEILDRAHAENRKLLNRFEQCLATDEWPGYGEEIVDIGIPSWGLNELEESL